MKTINLLFVCLGNICRSPAAEGIMQSLIESEGLTGQVTVDSAGTIAYHSGEKADARMIATAAKRGYDLTSIARRFEPRKDFKKFDYILAMDGENYNDLISMDIDGKFRKKIHLITDFCTTVEASEVPDPYYGGDSGFNLVINILEDACKGLIGKIKNDLRTVTT
jgi:protein-tyrosine phosphatase